MLVEKKHKEENIFLFYIFIFYIFVLFIKIDSNSTITI